MSEPWGPGAKTVCKWPGCDKSAKGRGTSLCYEHLDRRAGLTHGRGHAGVKPLTPEQVAEIRLRMSRFENPKKIAALFGVTTRTIHNVMRRGS